MELTTRVATQAQQLKIGSLTIDKDNFRVTKGTQQFLLPKKEFDLLYLLASNTQKVFKRDEILEKYGVTMLLLVREPSTYIFVDSEKNWG